MAARTRAEAETGLAGASDDDLDVGLGGDAGDCERGGGGVDEGLGLEREVGGGAAQVQRDEGRETGAEDCERGPRGGEGRRRQEGEEEEEEDAHCGLVGGELGRAQLISMMETGEKQQSVR